MMKTKYLILGAGISGLSFALEKNNNDYIIIEKDSLPGGLAKSFFEKKYVWDVAGHFFHFHSNKTKQYYDNIIGDALQVKAKKIAKIFYDGRYIDAPFQYNIHQLPKNELIKCITDAYFCSLNNSNDFSNFIRNRYGAAISEKFLIPYNEKLYKCKMNDLEKDSMGSFLPSFNFDVLMKSLVGKKQKTYNDSFNYPVNGCSSVINKIIERLNSNRIKLNEEAVEIDLKNKIVISNKNKYKYEYLISTIPLNKFAFISKLCVDDGDIFSYNKILVLNIGFDRPSINKNVSWAYFPGKEIFYRVGFYNNIAKTTKLSIYVEISFGKNETINTKKILDIVIKDLKKAKIISNHKIVAFNKIIINPGYVHITNKSKEFYKNSVLNLEKSGVHMIGRYARWEYSAMDDSMEQAIELSKKI